MDAKTVYVLMDNDYPHSAYSDEAEALRMRDAMNASVGLPHWFHVNEVPLDHKGGEGCT